MLNETWVIISRSKVPVNELLGIKRTVQGAEDISTKTLQRPNTPRCALTLLTDFFLWLSAARGVVGGGWQQPRNGRSHQAIDDHAMQDILRSPGFLFLARGW